ncbi:MAG: hypothetical protein JWQ02_3515 [Capsulimonas sp.]|nr:hypothetical protein [Capsulimonas sp.]
MSKEQNILMLGILSIVCCGILGPFAWIQGATVIEQIDNQGYPSSERNLAVAGQICGMIGTGLWILGIISALMRASGHHNY